MAKPKLGLLSWKHSETLLLKLADYAPQEDLRYHVKQYLAFYSLQSKTWRIIAEREVERRRPMQNNESFINIIACQSLEREIKWIADEFKKPYATKVFPSSCHRNPEELGRLIENYLDSCAQNCIFFMAYGGCFSLSVTDRRCIFRLPAMNCAAILLGGDDYYQSLSNGSYFLTPHLALHWKPYLLGEDLFNIDTRIQSRLIKWFTPIERIILIELQTDTFFREYESAQKLALTIRKPLVRVVGDLSFLRKQYGLFLKTMANVPTHRK